MLDALWSLKFSDKKCNVIEIRIFSFVVALSILCLCCLPIDAHILIGRFLFSRHFRSPFLNSIPLTNRLIAPFGSTIKTTNHLKWNSILRFICIRRNVCPSVPSHTKQINVSSKCGVKATHKADNQRWVASSTTYKMKCTVTRTVSLLYSFVKSRNNWQNRSTDFLERKESKSIVVR